MLVMNIEWDYNYYQPWSDNEWFVELRTNSTKVGENSMQMCNVLYYYLNYLFYTKQ